VPHPLVAEAMKNDRQRIVRRLERARRSTAYTEAEERQLAERVRRLETELTAHDRLIGGAS
jgi:hypothetical protein